MAAMKRWRCRGVVIALLLFGAVFCHADNKSKLVSNLESGKMQTVVAYGTSLTASGAWVGQLQATLDRRYPGKVKVINSGADGMSSEWGVENLDQRVIAKKPNTVFIEFAINDAFLSYKTTVNQARRNLENMIDRILAANPACEIILMVMNPPLGTHLESRPNFRDYYQMYRDVARERGLPLIDHYPSWEKILSQMPSLFKRYIPDGIHPGVQGCRMVVTPIIVKSLGID